MSSKRGTNAPTLPQLSRCASSRLNNDNQYQRNTCKKKNNKQYQVRPFFPVGKCGSNTTHLGNILPTKAYHTKNTTMSVYPPAYATHDHLCLTKHVCMQPSTPSASTAVPAVPSYTRRQPSGHAEPASTSSGAITTVPGPRMPVADTTYQVTRIYYLKFTGRIRA